MLKQLLSSYGAGWRAGMAGGSLNDNPFAHLHGACWCMGWVNGMRERLARAKENRRPIINGKDIV